MQDVEGLFKTAVGEIERMLGSKTVVGEPLVIEGNTLIPLVSVGFGFGAGGGTGKCGKEDEGTGGGTAGGGGVKPVALVIVGPEGVRVEPIRGAAATVMEKVAEAIAKTGRKKKED